MSEPTRPTIVVFAYSCAPDVGSEPGAGWGMVDALNQIADPIVLVGGRHIPAIRGWEQNAPEDAPTFIEVPEPKLEPYMKWHRIPRFVVYLYWLRKARKAAEEIVSKRKIDAVAHFTYSTFWLPTPATNLGVPSIWGPVGGGVRTPKSLRKTLGIAGTIQEFLDYFAVRAMSLLPAVRRTAENATVRILQNSETKAQLPHDAQKNVVILNHALFNTVPPLSNGEDGRYALWVSPMQTRKGPQLAIEGLARTKSGIRLVMVGDGPQRKALQHLADLLGVGDRVEFTGWIDRERAVRYMNEATTVIFTGLREEGGLALTEAMHTARQLIVLDHGGAGAIARRANDPDRVALISPNSAGEVAADIGKALDAQFESVLTNTPSLLDIDRAQAEFAGAVRAAIGDDA